MTDVFFALMGFILTIVLLVTFFRIATRLRNIREQLDKFYAIETTKPENLKYKNCTNCGTPFQIFRLFKGMVQCPHCKATQMM